MEGVSGSDVGDLSWLCNGVCSLVTACSMDTVAGGEYSDIDGCGPRDGL